jgi:hypothetical protein
MVSMFETIKLINFAKKIIDKQSLKKIKKLKNKEEKISALKYRIKSELEMMHYDLKRKLSKLEREKKDVFSLDVKTGLLNSKIKYFEISLDKRDFKNILLLYKEIKKEMKNV